jgi:pyruvate dehydrogenase E2 component (dihydrolipoamide acetyltransferase)
MPPAEPELTPGETTQRLTRIQKGMVKSMSRAVTGPALSQVTRELDLGSVVADRVDRGPGHSINTYVMAAVASVLGDHPLVNGRLEDGAVIVPDRVNLGMAVAVDEGLVVPVIHGADRLTFRQLDTAIAAAAEKARAGKLKFEDIEGGTFTVSNLGMFGIDGGFALPPPPQAAILLVARARPVLVPDADGAPEARTLAWFGLTYDHRFVDGATAARLLTDLDSALSDAPALRESAGQR